MIKKILLFFLLFLLSFPSYVNAQSEFESNIEVDYNIGENGKTTVTYNVSLTNSFSQIYATAYTLNLSGIVPKNPRAYEENNQLNLEKADENGQTSLKVSFPNALVGKEKTRVFSIAFEDDSLASRTGEVWEISIPKLTNPDQFNNYHIKLTVDPSLGELAYISPNPSQSESIQYGSKTYYFNKETISGQGVVAAFGQFQVFSFDLTYHLENPLVKAAVTEIAIPPDTAYQKINYQRLDPAPKNIKIDEDGNWIAIYEMKPRERLDINASGAVQIFAGPRYKSSLSGGQRETNLASTEFWQTKSEIVTSISTNLKTPRDIYDYVVKNLNYDYQRVKPNIERLGAQKALLNPKSAICMEFTDSFVALARAMGIPAREINGYAYTENPELKPLSLVSDVLHSWPEYWDEEKGVWIPVDPTWGNTTGGIDYFSKLDLRHFTFVIHGKDSVKPFPPGSYKLGASPQKDVFVSFGSLPKSRIAIPKIEARVKSSVPFTQDRLKITIKNPGPTSIEDKYLEIYFDNRLALKEKLDIVPPFAYFEKEIAIPFSILGHNTPDSVAVAFDGQKLNIPTQKTTVIILSLIVIFVLIALAILFVLLRQKNEKSTKTNSKGSWSLPFSRLKWLPNLYWKGKESKGKA